MPSPQTAPPSPPAPVHRGGPRRAVRTLRALVVVALTALVAAGVAPAPTHAVSTTPLQRWLAQSTVYIAHRGGSADWPEGSPLAYRRSTAWNPRLALEFSARRTADGVWVASEDATTGRVFGRDLVIARSTWSQLASLRSTVGGQPMSRLRQDVLDVVPRDRVLFVDDKDDAHVGGLLDLLDQYGGRRRTVVKSFCEFTATPAAARARGYTTWGYYYPSDMGEFAATQGRFDLLGLRYDATAADYRTARATGKRVIAHIVASPAQAAQGLGAGATGLMVSGVREVVPRD